MNGKGVNQAPAPVEPGDSLALREFREVWSGSGEPDWLVAIREEAWRVFQQLPLPGPKDKRWQKTSLAAINLDAILAHAKPAPAVALTPQTNLAKGVVFSDIISAAREHPELARRYLIPGSANIGPDNGETEASATSRPAGDKLRALNAALFGSGYFIYIPEGVKVGEPLRIRSLAPNGCALAMTRSVIVLEKGAQAVVLEEIGGERGYSPGDEAYPRTDAAYSRVYIDEVLVYIGEGARLRFSSLQERETTAFSYVCREARVAESGAVEWLIGEIGSRLGRSETLSLLQGRRSSSRSKVFYMGNRDQHLDISAGAVHTGEGTASRTDVRGALASQARAVYRGLGSIKKGAHEADASQSQKVLLLSPAARAENNPALLIGERDVRADHSSATAPPSEDHLFYMMSRGLSRVDAQRMIILAHFQPFLDDPSAEGMKEVFENAVSRKLDAMLAEAGV